MEYEDLEEKLKSMDMSDILTSFVNWHQNLNKAKWNWCKKAILGTRSEGESFDSNLKKKLEQFEK